MSLTLPARFEPTHQTAGLPGYPAVDVFAPAGTLVRAGSYGRVVKLSGRDPTGDETPGGAYGRSVYWRNSVTGVTRYATHLECVCLEVGDAVRPYSPIGRVARAPRGSGVATEHVHLGVNRG
jgi:hypothetical protein